MLSFYIVLSVNNEMGTVSVFLKEYDNAVPYRYLDKVICQWRRKEYNVRKECGLDLVKSTYPGCFPMSSRRRYLRREDTVTTAASIPTNATKLLKRDVKISASTDVNSSSNNNNKHKHHPKGFRTVHDVLLYNDQHRNNPNHSNVKIHMEEGNFETADESIDWNSFVANHSRRMRDEEERYQKMRAKKNDNGRSGNRGNLTNSVAELNYRKLISYDEIPWFNYWPMLGVRTEYYFRYSGSQTIPPCYGDFDSVSRKGTNHWRVMKDPIRIHPRQLTELKRLIAERIAPNDDSVKSLRCKPDTAARVTRDTLNPNKYVEVDTARPLQSWDRVHYKTFCECKDWVSKWPEDRSWCTIDDMRERFYEKPYNFDAS